MTATKSLRNGIYKPHAKQQAILNRAYKHILSVPYKVSLRWLFYRIWQDNFYAKYATIPNGKDKANHAFEVLLTRARREFWDRWHPNTLSDDTRETIHRGHGCENEQDAINDMKLECRPLSHWFTQDFYVECWFEARAMIQQFKTYTDGITLRPLGGQPSLSYRWEIAKELESIYKKYDKPIVILYFGDCDRYGSNICESTHADVSAWCNVSYELIFCGLTYEQAKQYRLPDNPEKPGQYQWEALSDADARAIITSNLDRFVSVLKIQETEERESKLDEWLYSYREEIVEAWEEKNELGVGV